MSSTPDITIIPTTILTSPDTVRTIKFALLNRAPGISQGSLDESLAAGFGFKSRAGLLHALQKGVVIVPISDDAFRERLRQLSRRKNKTPKAPKGLFENIVARRLAVDVNQGIQRRLSDGSFEFLDDGRPEPQQSTRKSPTIREAMENPLPSPEALLGEKGLQAILNAMENPFPLPPRDPNAPNAFLEKIVKPIVVARSSRRLPFVQPNSVRRT